MNSITKTAIFFLVCAAMVILAHQSASACEVNDFYNTKEGTLAAFTQEALTAATRFQEEGNKEKLADLMKSGTVVRLTGDVKVQVVERSVVFKTLKIKIPDEKEPYWVKDGSLTPINGN
jgi:hypothetical protein